MRWAEQPLFAIVLDVASQQTQAVRRLRNAQTSPRLIGTLRLEDTLAREAILGKLEERHEVVQDTLPHSISQARKPLSPDCIRHRRQRKSASGDARQKIGPARGVWADEIVVRTHR